MSIDITSKHTKKQNECLQQTRKTRFKMQYFCIKSWVIKGLNFRKLIIILTVVDLYLLFFISSAGAQAFVRVEIPSSPNPVGSGARALGMGGAFIAIADDATAASWNPGGLIQLEKPEVSAVLSCIYREEDNNFHGRPEASGSFSINNYNLNYLSVAYPFTAAERNMTVSLNYQHMFNFNRTGPIILLIQIRYMLPRFSTVTSRKAHFMPWALPIAQRSPLNFRWASRSITGEILFIKTNGIKSIIKKPQSILAGYWDRLPGIKPKNIILRDGMPTWGFTGECPKTGP